jgi:hemerythrin-like domain-containing protein
MKIAKLAGAAAARGFDEASWNEFLPTAQEFCEQLQAHIQKEEMALLPMLEDNMNAETDARLIQEYAEIV